MAAGVYEYPLYRFRDIYRGGLYTYEGGVIVELGASDVPGQVEGLEAMPGTGTDTSATGGALRIPPYGDGLYAFTAAMSFSASKVGTAHGEAYHNEEEIFTTAWERTITNVNSTGSAGATGMYYFAAGDSISFWIEYNSTNVDISVPHFSMILEPLPTREYYSTTTARTLSLYITGAAGTAGRMTISVDYEVVP